MGKDKLRMLRIMLVDYLEESDSPEDHESITDVLDLVGNDIMDIEESEQFDFND